MDNKNEIKLIKLFYNFNPKLEFLLYLIAMASCF